MRLDHTMPNPLVRKQILSHHTEELPLIAEIAVGINAEAVLEHIKLSGLSYVKLPMSPLEWRWHSVTADHAEACDVICRRHFPAWEAQAASDRRAFG
jgi:hypothetical protein